jgi:hypothetical protein
MSSDLILQVDDTANNEEAEGVVVEGGLQHVHQVKQNKLHHSLCSLNFGV